MTSSPTVHREHPLAALVARVHAELDAATDLPVWSLGPAEAGALSASLTRLTARVAGVEFRVAAHAQSVMVEDLDGATSTANWCAHATRATRSETHRKLRLAAALEPHTPVADALAAGTVLADQAAVIVHAVDALPEDLDPALVARAEAHLLGLAGDFDATALRRLGKGLLTVVAPEVGEAHEAAALAREEREAAGECPVEHGRGRARAGAREVHPALGAGRDVEEGAAGDRGPEAPGRGDRPRATTAAECGEAGGGVRRVRRAVPDRGDAAGGRRERDRGGHDEPGDPDRRPGCGQRGHR